MFFKVLNVVKFNIKLLEGETCKMRAKSVILAMLRFETLHVLMFI